MTVKRLLKYLFLAVILVAGLLDAYRYLKPGTSAPDVILNEQSFKTTDGKNIIMVYNAKGGIFPGLVDVVHKEIFPSIYPCNLCMLAFGSFGPKKEWREYLESLPYKKLEYHKEQFRKNFLPENLPLPAILLQSETTTELLVSAEEINSCSSLEQLINKVKDKLK